jgi:uncharacterized protein
MDRAALLSPDTRRALESRLAALETSTGHQLVVHTTPSLEGLAIEDYSLQVAEQWKIGQKGLDNGVILTVAPIERQVRIEVGYGLEGVLPDAIASRIIREQITPEFRSGNMEGGILAGVTAISAVIRNEELPLPKRGSRTAPPPWQVIAFWILLITIVGLTRTPLLWWLFGISAARHWGSRGRGGYYGGGGFRSGGGFGGGGFKTGGKF